MYVRLLSIVLAMNPSTETVKWGEPGIFPTWATWRLVEQCVKHCILVLVLCWLHHGHMRNIPGSPYFHSVNSIVEWNEATAVHWYGGPVKCTVTHEQSTNHISLI